MLLVGDLRPRPPLLLLQGAEQRQRADGAAAMQQHLGAGGAFPRTDLLGDQFFQSETEKEVVGKTVKTEGKTEMVVDKIEQDDADFKGTRQSFCSQCATDNLTLGFSLLPQMSGRSPVSPRRPKYRLTSSHGPTESSSAY